MSTHDYNLANQSGASFRSDLNNCLAAILSNNSNASAPSTTVAYSIWADTNAGKLKIRNSSNDGFVDLINLDGTIQRDVSLTGDLTLTDKIIHSGDTNTAIRFPANDTFTIETAGSERLRVDASGNVGISTSSPRARLDLGNGISVATSVTRTADRYQILLDASDTTDAFGNNIGFILNGGSTVVACINAVEEGGNGSTGLSFATSSNSGNDPVEAIRIDESGKVGIGTASPSKKLQVEGSVQFGDGGGFDMNINGTRHQFSIGGSEKMRITSDGALGIGTTSPDGRLHLVTGATTDDAHVTFHASATSGTNNSGEVLKVISSRGTGNTGAIFNILTNTSTSVLSAHGDGKVGIGTTSPSQQMDLSSTAPNIRLTDTADGHSELDGNAASLRFIADKGNAKASTTITFLVDNSTKMTIDSSGNIGAPSGSNIYNASDSRLKKNVINLDKGLTAINSLRPVSFNWIDGFCDDETNTLYGFLAQEVQALDTNLIENFSTEVNLEDDAENPTIFKDVLRVNEKFIIPILVKAIQELSAKVTALEGS